MRKITLFFLLLISCNLNTESEKNIIAKVGENFFTYDDLIEKIPKNIQRLDSTLIVNSIIEKWALNELLINNESEETTLYPEELRPNAHLVQSAFVLPSIQISFS